MNSQPLATLTFSPLDFSNSFVLIDSIFAEYKLKVLSAESHFSLAGCTNEHRGITILFVFTNCDDDQEKLLDRHLRSTGMGYLEGHLSIGRHGEKQKAAKWVIRVGGNRE